MRWAVLHIDFDDCIYRPFDTTTGQWLAKPMSRAEAIKYCASAGLSKASTQLRLGNAVLDINRLGARDGTGRWRESSNLRRQGHGGPSS